jgi:Skp family chaperone for outer membrane proteins
MDRKDFRSASNYFSHPASHHIAMGAIELLNATRIFSDWLIESKGGSSEIEEHANELLATHQELLDTIETELQTVPKELSVDQQKERLSREELIRFYATFEHNQQGLQDLVARVVEQSNE